MRAVRSLWWILILVPLAAPAPAPAMIAGHAHALVEPVAQTDRSTSPDPPAPADDGIRDVRSWLIPPPPSPAPPAREWGPGNGNPIWPAQPAAETPLEGTSRPGSPPAPSPPEGAADADPPAEPETPAPEGPSPGPAPEDPPAPPSEDPPAPPEGGDPAEPAPSEGSCLLCMLLEMPRRVRIL